MENLVEGDIQVAKSYGLTGSDEANDMQESLPGFAIDGRVPFRMSFQVAVPEESGIYIFHDFRGVLYIGRSRNLRRRFNEHFWVMKNPLLRDAIESPVGPLEFSWWLVDEAKQVDAEKEMIRWFESPCNRISYGSSKRDLRRPTKALGYRGKE